MRQRSSPPSEANSNTSLQGLGTPGVKAALTLARGVGKDPKGEEGEERSKILKIMKLPVTTNLDRK